MNKDRLEQIVNECIGYIYELKDNLDPDENREFWRHVIGLTDDEIKYFFVLGHNDETIPEEQIKKDICANRWK